MKMKLKYQSTYPICLFIAVALAAFPAVCSGQSNQVPENVVTALTRRETSLSAYNALWKYQQDQTNPNATSQEDSDIKARMLAQADQDYERRGMRPDIRDKLHAQSARLLSAQQVIVPSTHSIADIAIRRGGDIAEFQTTFHTQQGSATQIDRDVDQFYGDKIEVVNENVSINGSKSAPTCTVWATPSDSADYMFPKPIGFTNYPAEVVAVLSKNPLHLYGADWVVIRSSGDDMVLQSQVTQGNLAPFTSQVTLSKKYGWAPRLITLHRDFGEGHSLDVSVETIGFKSIENGGEKYFAPSLVRVQNNGVTVSSVWWRLVSMTSSSATVAMGDTSGARVVVDHRLQGDQITQADFQSNDNLVSYDWRGNFANFDELKDYLRHETNTPKKQLQASSAPVGLIMGGIIVLIGAGGFLLRRRNAALS
ncbi:hypothetical protein CCAX7_002620 [Capsulimonas corticalis]|uniref:Uncharacterized protein n=1 Tax=Capsulimonas corticalis TaxID=2219043 RepID=A0A402CS32_9BACT|nr:hypothetical protein [Capsulimonas corticalis]BDI28211.1 hypothetical protein CCAX7_002620 [Capsulimonas corticalis]